LHQHIFVFLFYTPTIAIGSTRKGLIFIRWVEGSTLSGLGEKQISKETFIVTGSQLTSSFLASVAESALMWVGGSFSLDEMGEVC